MEACLVIIKGLVTWLKNVNGERERERDLKYLRSSIKDFKRKDNKLSSKIEKDFPLLPDILIFDKYGKKKKGKNGCKTWWKIQNGRFFLLRFTFVNSPWIALERPLKYYRKTLFYKIHLSKLKNDKIFEEIRLEEENFRRRSLTYIHIYKMARVSSQAPFLILRKRVEEVVWQVERGEGERGVIDLNGWSSYKF